VLSRINAALLTHRGTVSRTANPLHRPSRPNCRYAEAKVYLPEGTAGARPSVRFEGLGHRHGEGPLCSIDLRSHPTPVHAAPVCGRRSAAPWTSSQPELGVGRYGESIALLLISRTISQKEPRQYRRGYRLLIRKIPVKEVPTYGPLANYPCSPCEKASQLTSRVARPAPTRRNAVVPKHPKLALSWSGGNDISATQVDQATAHAPRR
jgi:hypothetical protein